MPTNLADARRSLLRAKEAATKRLEDLAKEMREVKASLKSLDAALKALGRSRRGQHASDGVVESVSAEPAESDQARSPLVGRAARPDVE